MTSKQIEGSVRKHCDAAVIDLVGEMNGFGQDRLNALYDEATQQNPSCIVINFSEVVYIDSMGISLIVGLLSEIRKTDLRLLAYGLTDHYIHIFEITRLTDYIPIFESEQQALEFASA